MTLTEQVLGFMKCLDGARGHILLEGRTVQGIAPREELICRPPFNEVPLGLLRMLERGLSVRVGVVSRDASQLVDLPVIAVLWKPTTTFEGRHQVTEAGRQMIRTALNRMPPANALVDGQHEVGAMWRLIEPIPAVEARDVLQEFAEALGAVGALESLEGFSLPMAGPVRNWSVSSPDSIEIVDIDPSPLYTLSQLHAHREDPHETPAEASAENRGRRRRRSEAQHA